MRALIFALTACAAAAASTAWAAPNHAGASIYTCTDARGYRITSDRPIVECSDREQRILSPQGLERGRLGPSLSERERELERLAAHERERERQRAVEAERMARQLLARYPNAAAHDQERATRMVQFDQAVELARARLAEIEQQISSQGEADAAARERAQAARQSQQRVLQTTLAARQRAQERWQLERGQLEQMWQQHSGAAAPASQSERPAR